MGRAGAYAKALDKSREELRTRVPGQFGGYFTRTNPGHGFGHDYQSASISFHITRSLKVSCVRQAVMILDHTQSWSIAVPLGQTTCLRAAGSSPAGRTTETSLGHPEGLLTTNDSHPGEDPPPRI